MNKLNAFLALLGIRPGEALPVLLVFTVFFGLGLARTLTRNSAYTLFLLQYDGTDLPYVYIGTSMVVTLTMYVYLRISRRLSFFALLLGNLLFSLTVQVLFRLVMAVSQAQWLALALPIWYEGFCILLNLAMWGVASQLFTVRQGKRLFGLVSGGVPLAFIVAGFVTTPLVRWFGATNLLIAAVGGLLLALAAVLVLLHRYPEQVRPPPRVSDQSPPAASLRDLWNHPYARLMALLFLFSPLTFFFIDNIFYERVGVQFPGEAELAAFMGFYSMLNGVLTLICGALVTGPFLSRYGVGLGVLALPLLHLLAILPLTVIGSFGGLIPLLFWPAFAAKLLNYAASTIDSPTRNILYQPLPAHLRVQLKAATEGILQAVVIGAVGLLLLVLSKGFGLHIIHFSYILIAILAGWVVVALAVGRAYPTILMQALVRRRLGGDDGAPSDGNTLAVLHRGLQSPHEDVILYTVNQLVKWKDPALPATLEQLLTHPAPRVRQHSLKWIEQLGLRSLAPTLRQQIATERSPASRGLLLRTLAALEAEESLALLSAHLADPEPEIRLNAMTGLLRYGGIAGILTGGRHLLRQLDSPNPQDRVDGAYVLGEVGVSQFYQPLIALLNDPEPAVQRAALEAAGRLRSPQVWPLVVAKLDTPAVYRAALAALAAGGEAVMPALTAALPHRQDDPGFWLRLAHLAMRLRSPHLIDLLQANMAIPDLAVRSQILRALHRGGYGATGEAIARVKAQMRMESRAATERVAALTDLPETDATLLLRRALHTELEQHRAHLFALLAFLVDPQTVRQAQQVLEMPTVSAEQRAFALEILDIVTPQELKALLFPLLEDLSPAQRLGRLNRLFPQPALDPTARLHTLVTAPPGTLHRWTKACALEAIGRLDLTALAPTVADLHGDPDPLLRETACWTTTRLAQATEQQPANSLSTANPLLTIQKVICLKGASIFAEVPDEALAEVAVLLERVELAPNESLFVKGEPGAALYLIVAGMVRIHDGEHTLTTLGEREVVGEMALLDAELRSASATAVSETVLLRLGQAEFLDLLEEHGGMAPGILRVLAQRLRARSLDLTRLRAQVL
jgi:ATP:ADP antiporter, AAA family